MIPIPTPDEQRRFVFFFFQMGSLDKLAISEIIDQYTTAQVKEVAISLVPAFVEMGFSEARINEMLAEERLPGFAAFKKLNSRHLSRILKKKTITSGDDILLVKEALENNLLTGAELERAELLIGSLNI